LETKSGILSVSVALEDGAHAFDFFVELGLGSCGGSSGEEIAQEVIGSSGREVLLS